MSEEGGGDHFDMVPQHKVAKISVRTTSNATTDVDESKVSMENPPMSPRNFENPFSRAHTTLEMDDYFVRTLCQLEDVMLIRSRPALETAQNIQNGQTS